jgi:hypothetical protein
MRRVTCLLLVFCLFAAPLRANLGETIQQCIVRYGAPTGYSEAGPKVPFGTLVFIAGGFVLVVFIDKGREIGARVSKSDKSAFTAADLQSIMGADTAGSSWISSKSDDPTCLAWQRADNAKVLYDQVNHMLIFTSPAMDEALKAAAAKPALPVSSPSSGSTTNQAPAK